MGSEKMRRIKVRKKRRSNIPILQKKRKINSGKSVVDKKAESLDKAEETELAELTKKEQQGTDLDKKEQKRLKKLLKKKKKMDKKEEQNENEDKTEKKEKKSRKKKKTVPFEYTLTKLRKILRVCGLANPKLYKELKGKSNKNQVDAIKKLLEENEIPFDNLSDQRIKKLKQEYALKKEMEDLGININTNHDAENEEMEDVTLSSRRSRRNVSKVSYIEKEPEYDENDSQDEAEEEEMEETEESEIYQPDEEDEEDED